ncbi:hypothetical protein [Maricaulis sp.]|uniref:hypothetical protein n=1 Tax=Maricaulis sp. TaxID=1486257 RepID=UPI002B26EB1A|nr:hypothetical protein [Maricaulis sp.]
MASKPADFLRPGSRKWRNGVTVRYGFLMQNPPTWMERQDIEAFAAALSEWLQPPCGLHLEHTTRLSDAQVRVRVKLTAPLRSRVGTEALEVTELGKPTVTFNRHLNSKAGRLMALHEIGHILGFHHEHQSRRAALGWKEPATTAHFRAMGWSDAVIRKNVFAPRDGRISGPDWDPASIMHYPLPAGLLTKPESWAGKAIPQANGISAADHQEVLAWYPPL